MLFLRFVLLVSLVSHMLFCCLSCYSVVCLVSVSVLIVYLARLRCTLPTCDRDPPACYRRINHVSKSMSPRRGCARIARRPCVCRRERVMCVREKG